MTRRMHAIQAFMVSGGVALIGCGTASTPRSSPTAPSLATPSSFGVLHPASADLQSASGNAHITISTNGGIPVRFTFSAHKFADGDVTGQWQAFKDDGALFVHGVTTCLGIVGNQARVGGEITKTSDPTTDPVGTPVIWTVVDNGVQSDPPDQLSQIIIVNSDQRAFHCTSGFDLPLFPEEQGNVEVRP